jgi:hypothetical protein
VGTDQFELTALNVDPMSAYPDQFDDEAGVTVSVAGVVVAVSSVPFTVLENVASNNVPLSLLVTATEYVADVAPEMGE